MPNKPIDFPVFTGVDESTYREMAKKIVKYLGNLSDFLGIKGVDIKEIKRSEKILRDIIELIEKRRINYHIFLMGIK